MPELNVDVPLTYCKLRAEYLYNCEDHHGLFVPCAVFAASSIQGRAVGFHVLLSNGALIYRLPISALVHLETAPDLPLDHLELWDCFSAHMTAQEYIFLRGMRVDVLLKDGEVYPGQYLFTLDWWGSSLADNPGEGGHKCAHVLALDNGCYAAQPNNRLRWYDPSFVTEPFPVRPDYKTNDQVWSVENRGPRWATEPTSRMFYDLEHKTDGKHSDKA